MFLRFLFFLTVMSSVLGSVHYFVWARLIRDPALPPPFSTAGTLLFQLLFALLFLAFPFVRALPRTIARPFALLSFSWLGTMFLLFVSLAGGDLVRVLASAISHNPESDVLVARFVAGISLLITTIAVVLSVRSALSPVAIKKVRITIPQLHPSMSGYRIVQLSDVHIGATIGQEYIEAVVARVNSLSPDLVAITGDLVDGNVASLGEHARPLAHLKSKDGVYFVTGNHEYYSGVDEWVPFLAKELGFRVLQNERVSIGGTHGFDLAGTNDSSGKAFGPQHGEDLAKALAGRHPERAVILLAHQPRTFFQAAPAGVALQLSGHTHGGQLLPWALAVKLQQSFVVGLHRRGASQLYVSCGTGYWGPPMRLGAPAEITEIELVAENT